MKKLLAILLTLVIVCGLTTVTFAMGETGTTAAYGGGSGTETEPYQISTAEHLQALATAVNRGTSYTNTYFKVTKDIDLSTETNWTPIGGKDKPFQGTFDGDGKTISHLTISGESDYVGLFGNINTPASIKNVTLHIASVTGRSNVGALIGSAYTGTVSDCKVTGNITVSGNYMVGGLAGSGYASMSGCSVIGATGSTVTGVYKSENLEGDNVSGLVGFRGEGDIKTTNCTVQNLTVIGTRKVGGVLGYLHHGNTISGCTASNIVVKSNATAEYIAKTAEERDEKGASMAIGGIVGVVHNKDGTAMLSDCMAENIKLASDSPGVAMGYISGADRYAGMTGATTTTATNVVPKGDCTGATADAALGKDSDVIERPAKPSRPSGGSNDVESAETFDAGVALYGAMALSSALGAAYVQSRKEKF